MIKFEFISVGNANNWNKWYGPSGRDMNYDWNELYNSDAAKAIKQIKVLPNKKLVMELINATQVSCNVKEEEEEEDESDQSKKKSFTNLKKKSLLKFFFSFKLQVKFTYSI